MGRAFSKVVVANRGAVAARVLRALSEMGISSVAVYSDADRDAPWLEWSSEAYRIGPAAARESYLDQRALLDVLKQTKADALHPGYGFLAENAEFAAADHGPGRHVHRPGRALDRRHGPQDAGARSGQGATVCRSARLRRAAPAFRTEIAAAARKIGYPVLVKPAGGGGGIGMLPARNEAELMAAVEHSALARASAASATPRSTSNVSSSGPAMSSCKLSPTILATARTCSSAIARFSAAIRK